ncbi:hypothetical protein LY76DRAFT_297865 [Colletotrichum caudatum]|nr:hypothetical protein LY76DRAFT_297865 [Colletotrichum caudatum]
MSPKSVSQSPHYTHLVRGPRSLHATTKTILEVLTKCHQPAVVVPASVSHYIVFLPLADHCPRYRGIVGQCRTRQGRALPIAGCLIAGRFPTGSKCRILGTACLFSWPVTQHGFPLSSALASARSWPASKFRASKTGCIGSNWSLASVRRRLPRRTASSSIESRLARIRS